MRRPNEPELVTQMVLNTSKTAQLSHQEIKAYLEGFFVVLCISVIASEFAQ